MTDDAFLDTNEAAEYLTKRGLKTSPKTLNKKRCTGGGPEFHKFGRRIIYKPPDLDRYADAHVSGPLKSTSAAA